MADKPTYKELEQRINELKENAAKRSREKEIFLENEQLKLAMNEAKRVEQALDMGHRQLLCIFDSIDQPVYVSDPDTHELLYVNKALKTTFGNVLGHKCYKALQNMDAPCPFCTNDHIFGENVGRQYIWEFRNKRTGRWFHCVDRAIRWPDGRMVKYEMAIDITEFKKTELSLEESEQRYRRIFESSLDGMFIFDSGGFIREVNPAACSMHGYAAEELIGSHGKILVEPESHHLFDDFVQTVLTGQTFSTEAVDIRKDGSRLTVEVRGTPIGLKGKPHLLGIVRDITEHKEAEEAIQFKNTILLTQQETSLDGILVVDEKGKIISFNQRFVEIWDIPSHVIESRLDKDALRSVLDKLTEPEVFRERVEYLYAHRNEKSQEEITLVDGRTLERYSAPMLGPEGRYFGRIWYLRDITERKGREEEVRENEQRYRAVVEDMPAMICRFLPDGTLTFVNSAYCNYFGKRSEDLIGRNFFQFVPDEDKEKVRRHFLALKEEAPMATYEHQVIAPDGTIRWQEWTDRALFDDKCRRVEYQSIGRDISEARMAQRERERMEKQLQQAQKMEAIGTLAGGIAHDFNNILGAIFGYSELALTHVSEENPVHYYLEQILRGGYRARDLVAQILAFSRQVEQVKKPIKIGPLIKETAKFLRASLPATIEISTEIKGHTDLIVADPTQIHQIIMNLCTNAGHAMRESGGVLRLRLLEMDIDAHSSLSHPELTEGPYLRLDVSDTGQGISPEILERIFDPYFTTKERGEGTGLGLAVVHGIVKKHGGAITVDSEPGKGTTFHVFLPRVAAISEQKEEEVSSVPGGRERVLFVDDEVALVELARDVLERLGYEVVTRMDSIETLEVFRADPDGFDIVITDQTMPNLTGVELAKKIMGIRPDIPIILCTGFSERINSEEAKTLGISEFLFKPIVISDLAQSIRRALDKKR